MTIKLTHVATALQEKERPEWNIGMSNPEYLHDWIFLSMDRAAMANFVGTSEGPSLSDDEEKDMSMKRLLFLHIEDTIREILEEQNMTKDGITVNLRLAEAEDTDTIAGLVQGLAIYEKEPDAVNVTAEDYFIDGYNSEEPLFYCILADVTTMDESGAETTTTAAMGLFYFGHDLLDGPFLYLEDLYCEEAYRKKRDWNGNNEAASKHLVGAGLQQVCLGGPGLECPSPFLLQEDRGHDAERIENH